MWDPSWVCMSPSLPVKPFPPHTLQTRVFHKVSFLGKFSLALLIDKMHVCTWQGRGGGRSALQWYGWDLRPKGLHPFPQDERPSGCWGRREVSPTASEEARSSWVVSLFSSLSLKSTVGTSQGRLAPPPRRRRNTEKDTSFSPASWEGSSPGDEARKAASVPALQAGERSGGAHGGVSLGGLHALSSNTRGSPALKMQLTLREKPQCSVSNTRGTCVEWDICFVVLHRANVKEKGLNSVGLLFIWKRTGY